MLGRRDLLSSSALTPASMAPFSLAKPMQRQAEAPKEVASPPPAPTSPATKTADLPPIVAWQVQLAREAAAGRGIDALRLILTELKQHYAADREESALLDAIQQLSDCAHRHLREHHESATIEAIFDGVFPPTKEVNNALDATAINIDAQAEIQRLASLPNIQYEHERIAAAARLGMRATVLDAEVRAARPQDTKGQGRAFELPPIEPWPSAVNGAELLDEISDTIKRYIVLPSDSLDALALWALHAHCFNCFAHSPRAAITSPEKGCGKTTTLDVLGRLVPRPLSTANATVSAIFRIVELAAPTLLIDEADTFLKENDGLRGILNTGHRRGGQVTRTVGDDHEPRQFSTWAPLAIAMIGRLPDTLNDRSIIISLRRRKPSEKVKSFRSDRTEDLDILARKMARWAQDHQARLTESDPDMGSLLNRVADNWRPLFAIADEAGADWPARARKIADAADAARIEQSVNALLLEDIRWVFDGRPNNDVATASRAVEVDRISSAELVEHLIAIEGQPWAEWKGGKPITQNGLARLLGRFEVLSGTIRLQTGQTAKGYYRSAFEDVFSRYLPLQSVTPSQLNSHGHCDALQSVTAEKLVTLPKPSQLNSHGHCDGVTVSNPRREAIDL